MAEECTLKGPIEKNCASICTSVWKIYKDCEERISSFDKWDFHKLQHLAEHHSVPIHDAQKNELDQDALVESLKGVAHCAPQYQDYFGCIDKCTAPKLFAKLR